MKKQHVLIGVVGVILVGLGITFLMYWASGNGGQASIFGLGSSRIENPYNIAPSKTVPGAFTYNYEFAKVTPKKGEVNFDLPIVPFDETKARKALGATEGLVDFGKIRDAWGYPVRENAYQKLAQRSTEKKLNLNLFKTEKAFAADNDLLVPGLVNCRANTSVTGYFKAYFEDVAVNNHVGYADPVHGQARRDEACHVLQDVATLIKLGQTNVTPNILFAVDPGSLPVNALAGASAYTGYYSASSQDNGSLYKYIISRQDPTPGLGNFDAFIITQFNGVSWDVDSTLNAGTYSFYDVMYHEMLHALGFRGLMPQLPWNASGHGTFDFNSYINSWSLTPANRFFNELTEVIQVNNPSWFTMNEVAYRGTKNIVGATPDGVRPVYSPATWEQGSSLSHFDMNRATNGEVYVMNPSVGTNTIRTIHNDEKEVLCHEGYQVLGMVGCELPTPLALDDTLLFKGVPAPVCVQFLSNDQSFDGGALSLNSINLISTQPGDSVLYYGTNDCTGSTVAATTAKSLRFIPTADTATRIIRYTNKDSVSNRISLPARISLTYCDTTDPDEYICNGGFEMGTPPVNGSISGCLDDTPFWCDFFGSVDMHIRSLNFIVPWSGSGWNGGASSASPNDRFVSGYRTGDSNPGGVTYNVGDNMFFESLYTKTSSVIPPGTYTLSFTESHFTNSWTSFDQAIQVVFSQAPVTGNVNAIPSNPTDFVFTASLLPGNHWPPGSWDQYSFNVQIPNNGAAYKYITFLRKATATSLVSHLVQSQSYALDNVSLKKVSYLPIPHNVIQGKVYNDQNANGSLNSNESGVDSAQVGLFVQGSTTPIQTTVTQNAPHLGEYSFSNVPDGSYNIVLMHENLYPIITQPLLNNPVLISGYTHAYQKTVTGNQTSSNNNFGIASYVDLCPNIPEVQSVVPIDYVLINNQCIPVTPTVSVVDVCPNLPDVQITVPTGYVRVSGKCLRLIIKKPILPIADPIIKIIETPKVESQMMLLR